MKMYGWAMGVWGGGESDVALLHVTIPDILNNSAFTHDPTTHDPVIQLADFGSARSVETSRQRIDSSRHQRHDDASVTSRGREPPGASLRSGGSVKGTAPQANGDDGLLKGVGTGGQAAPGGSASGRGVGAVNVSSATVSDGPSSAAAGSLQRPTMWFRSQGAFDGPPLPSANSNRRPAPEADEYLQRDNSKRAAIQYAGESPMDADDGGIGGGGGGGGGRMRHADIYACPSEGPDGGFKVRDYPQ